MTEDCSQSEDDGGSSACECDCESNSQDHQPTVAASKMTEDGAVSVEVSGADGESVADVAEEASSLLDDVVDADVGASSSEDEDGDPTFQ